MAKKDQESQEKQVLTEWQKRNLEFLRKKETEDSEEFANGKVVHSQEATSNESQPPVKKKVKKKKKTKRKKRKKGNTTSNIPIAQQNLAGLVVFNRCTPNRIFTFLYFTLVKTKGSHCIRNKKCFTRRCESCKWYS